MYTLTIAAIATVQGGPSTGHSVRAWDSAIATMCTADETIAWPAVARPTVAPCAITQAIALQVIHGRTAGRCGWF